MTTRPSWVLVVDDDATDRLRLFRLLEREGYHATVVDDGPTGLDLLRREPFDLVLLDLTMPGLDGYGALQAMKSDAQLRTIPVIVTSGADEFGTVVHCLREGAEDYLEKPVDAVLLGTRVEAALTRRRLQDREQEYLNLVGHLLQATTAIEHGGAESQSFDPLARRADGFGALARVLRDLATRVAEGG